jgi:hypothetical protein
MINLFVVSNNFSLQLSESIIESKKWGEKNAMLFMRNIGCRKKDYITIWHAKYASWGTVRRAMHLYRLRALVRKKTGGLPYRAFLSTGSDTLSRFVAKDRQCTEVCALEEGLGSYLHDIRYTSEREGFFLSRAASRPDADRYFAVSQHAFPGRDVEVIDLKSYPSEKTQDLHGNWLIVVDDLTVTKLSLYSFLMECKEAVGRIDGDHTPTFVSLHPAIRSESSRRAVSELEMKHFDGRIDTASRFVDTKYIGGVSSALFYNSLFGGASYSLANILRRRSGSYAALIDAMPQPFFNHVTIL